MGLQKVEFTSVDTCNDIESLVGIQTLRMFEDISAILRYKDPVFSS